MYFEKILNGKKIISLFNTSYKLYIRSNKDLEERFYNFKFSNNFEYAWDKDDFLDSFRRNFFSILMTSVLKDIGMTDNKVISYTSVLNCLRQIITSVDNIVDKEENGIIFLKGLDNHVVKNSLISIANQDVMNTILRDLGDDGKASMVIVEKIHSIAIGEGKRERSLYKDYPSKEYIVNEIHRRIGGELLELALCAPKAMEPSKKLSSHSRGLFKIGMALQGLDDLCDMQEDYIDKKVNLGIARLIEERDYTLNELSNVSFDEILDKDEEFVKNYLNNIGEDLFEGFTILQKNGYPLGTSDLNFLMRFLFKVRGLERFWKIMENDFPSYIKLEEKSK